MLLNSVEKGDRDSYAGYCLNFKHSGDMELFNNDCEGSIRMQWQTFSYNLFLKEIISSGLEM